MTNRLFYDWEAKNTAFKFKKFKKGESNDKFCITIPLKNSQNNAFDGQLIRYNYQRISFSL